MPDLETLPTADIFDDSPEAAARATEEIREQQVLQAMRREFNYFKREREAVMDPIWDECYRMYRAQTPDVRKAGEWRSRVHVPKAFINVEDVVPHLMAGIFDAEKPFRIFSTLKPQLAEAHEQYALYEWNENMNMEIKWEEIQKMKAIFGSAPFFTGFKAQFGKRKMWENQQSPDDPTLGVPTIIEREMPEYVGNFVESIHIYNVYPHPKATIDNVRQQYWVQFRTMEWFIKAGRFKNIDKITSAMRHTGSSSETGAGQEQAEVFGEMRNSFPNPGSEDSVGEFRVITKYDDDLKTVQTMVGPDGAEVLIEEDDYPLWHGRCPIQWERYTLIPKEFYGVGTIEPGISLMHEADLIRNQRRDNVTLAMNMGFEVRENDIDDEEAEMVSKPGFLVHSRTGKALTPIQYPDVTSDAMREASVVDDDLRGISGLGGPLSGQTDPNSPSGTKFSLQQKGQLMRLSRAIKRQALSVKEIASQMVSNTEQFYPVPAVRAVLGPLLFGEIGNMPAFLVPLRGFVQVQPVGVFANDDVLRQQYTNFINIMLADPEMRQELDIRKVARVGMKMFPQIPDVEGMFKQKKIHDIPQMRLAFQENTTMAAGRPIPPASPQDDMELHTQMHENLLEDRPDLAQLVEQHIQSHQVADQQRQLLQAGSGLGGGQGGGLSNPARQAASTSQEGIIRSSARANGRSLA